MRICKQTRRGWVAVCPDNPGIRGQGQTEEAAEEDLDEQIARREDERALELSSELSWPEEN